MVKGTGKGMGSGLGVGSIDRPTDRPIAPIHTHIDNKQQSTHIYVASAS